MPVEQRMQNDRRRGGSTGWSKRAVRLIIKLAICTCVVAAINAAFAYVLWTGQYAAISERLFGRSWQRNKTVGSFHFWGYLDGADPEKGVWTDLHPDFGVAGYLIIQDSETAEMFMEGVPADHQPAPAWSRRHIDEDWTFDSADVWGFGYPEPLFVDVFVEWGDSIPHQGALVNGATNKTFINSFDTWNLIKTGCLGGLVLFGVIESIFILFTCTRRQCRVWRGRCPACGYSISGLESPICPECGGKLVPTEAELADAEGRDYETAEQFLKRIKAERESRSNTKPKERRQRTKAKGAS